MTSELSGCAEQLRITEPLEYPDALALLHHASLVISDSGGIQEEATVFRKPIIVFRCSNERPEVEDGFGVRIHPGEPLVPVVTDWFASLPRINAKLAALRRPTAMGPRLGRSPTC